MANALRTVGSARLRSLVLILAALGLVGCDTADLRVDCTDLQWSAQTKLVRARVTNVGTVAATHVFVAFTPEAAQPSTPAWRPQPTFTIPSLAPGASQVLEADLQTYPVPSGSVGAVNAYLQTVQSLDIEADPKRVIDDARRDNNRRVVGLNGAVTAGVPAPLQYDEWLATILRGVQIEPPAAQALGLSAGYYRIGEARMWNATDNRAVGLSILASYQPTLMRQSDPFVFSDFCQYRYDVQGTRAELQDLHGHRLFYDVQFGGSCHVVQATLDGVPVRLSTQSYTTGALNSCGWASEPPWTTP